MKSGTPTIRRALTTLCLTAALSTGGVLAAGEASASTGGVDMQRACDKQYVGYGLRAVVLDQQNAYSWRCTSPWGNRWNVDVNRACAEQYGQGASAGLVSSRNPYSWYCRY